MSVLRYSKHKPISLLIAAIMMVSALLLAVSPAFAGEIGTTNVHLEFHGLENLGADYAYEGWLIIDGAPVSTGIFSVDDNGNPSQTDFLVEGIIQAQAAAFVLTIEPSPDNDPAPSATHVLAGDVQLARDHGRAFLTAAHPAALGNDFSTAAGPYILNAPSDDTGLGDYFNGIWWLDPTTGPGPTLELPTLPAGWAYEGWVVGENGPMSTGRFLTASGADSDGQGATGGSNGFPPFPGQDLVNPLTNLTEGYAAVISIEPEPDNSPNPFQFKPLVDHNIDDTGAGGIAQAMDNNAASFASGTLRLGRLSPVHVSWDFAGLEDLGADAVYEGWVIDGGMPVSTGTFTVDANGELSQSDFLAWVLSPSNVSAFVLTIEPAVDPDPAPNATHYLAGDFDNGAATLTIDHAAALGDDFTNAAGPYILNAPSDDTGLGSYVNGIWWLDPATGPGPTLELPTLPAGWMYEGWVVGPDGPMSTGTFLTASGADSDGQGATGGSNGFPPFPGQDLVNPLTDLTDGYAAVISVEPYPDNSPSPFTLKPLFDTIEDPGAGGVAQAMTNIAADTAPTGSASIERRVASPIEFAFDDLADLGEGWVYEGWLIDNGVPVTAGRFTVDGNGELSQTMFTAYVSDVRNVSTYVLTIEPEPDNSPAPSDAHVLGGDFWRREATLTAGHAAALGDDFSTAAGPYILNAPSDDTGLGSYVNGIWWLDPATGPGPTLELPTLPAGWTYEGWVVGPDGPMSTGTFLMASGADSDGQGATGGSNGFPPFPGQDLVNPLTDLTSGYAAVISIEPVPDNSPMPFQFKPLVDANIDDPGAGGVAQAMANNSAGFATGWAKLLYDPTAVNLVTAQVASTTGGTASFVGVLLAAVLSGVVLVKRKGLGRDSIH